MYALVYAAKGPFVLYKIYNISFEHGNDPPSPCLNNVKKNCPFFTRRLPLPLKTKWDKAQKWTTGTREAQPEEQEGRWKSLPLPFESLLHSWQQCTPQVRQGSLTTDSAEHLFWLLALQHGGHHPRHYQCHAFGQCSIAGRNPTVVSFTPARCFDKDMLT